MSKAYKGSDFERALCKRLSEWWTGGMRDDVFWRSSQSGGRATQRTKKGLSTYGSYGDIAAVDPIGEPLLKVFTIELKRGSSYGIPGDLLDFKRENGKHPWVACLLQAIRAHQQAGSQGWMLICRRDHRGPIVYVETRIIGKVKLPPPSMRYRLLVEGVQGTVDFKGIPMETFLNHVRPELIISWL